MAKKKVKVKMSKASKAVMNAQQFSMVRNEMMTLTREALNRMLSAQSDVDNACNYPLTIGLGDYRTMYDRLGLARRAVEIWPDECWQSFPFVYEKEDPEPTEFEKAWNKLQEELSIYTVLHRADVLSGIGHYGIILLGLDDGKDLREPAPGLNPRTGEATGDGNASLLYLRTFDQSVLTIDQFEKDMRSPRYGLPALYSINFTEPEGGASQVGTKIHWSRIIHLADNRDNSRVYGTSRLQAVYNNLLDIKKVSGGSGEMFWKGGFPGYTFELTPEAVAMGAEMDAESIKEQMLLWANGLQRWLALTGVSAKSLAPQVADPTGHVEVHLKLVAVSLGVPYRVLLGSEEAKLASVQDKRTWNCRIARRQNGYLTPLVFKPFIDRLIAVGALPAVEKYIIEWPDLNASTDDDIAKIALNRTDAFAKYVQGGVDALIPPREYFTQVQKLTDSEADAILKAAEGYTSELNPEPEPEPIPRQTKPSKAQGS